MVLVHTRFTHLFRNLPRESQSYLDDNQEDILHYFDTSKTRMINEEPKRVNIDFPSWMVHSIIP